MQESNWLTKIMESRFNETKLVHINFSTKKIKVKTSLTFDGIQIPVGNETKYLSLTLVEKLT